MKLRFKTRSRAARALSLAAGVMLAAIAGTAGAQLPGTVPARPEASTLRIDSTSRPDGTIVLLRAEAETYVDNDEARVSIFVEEQNADRAMAASAVNRKMADAIERVKKDDPTADVRSTGYFTNPEYGPRSNKVTGWQVRQEVLIVTRKLADLQKLVADVQSVAGVSGVAFGLSREAQRKVDAQLFDMAFADMRARMSSVAHALGKADKDVEIDEIDLTSVDRPLGAQMAPAPMMARAKFDDAVAQPKFEPGDSRQSVSFTAHVRVRR